MTVQEMIDKILIDSKNFREVRDCATIARLASGLEFHESFPEGHAGLTSTDVVDAYEGRSIDKAKLTLLKSWLEGNCD